MDDGVYTLWLALSDQMTLHASEATVPPPPLPPPFEGEGGGEVGVAPGHVPFESQTVHPAVRASAPQQFTPMHASIEHWMLSEHEEPPDLEGAKHA